MATRRECCDRCMWNGAVNKDGTMRAHKRRVSDVYSLSKQDASAARCPGSHKPYARFGAVGEEPYPQWYLREQAAKRSEEEGP